MVGAVAAAAIAVSDYHRRAVIGVEPVKNGLVQDWRGHWVSQEFRAEKIDE